MKTFTIEVPVSFEDTYKVRMDRDDTPVEVTRVFDMSKVTPEGLLAHAMKSIIIDAQAEDRRNALKKDSKDIPMHRIVEVKNPGTRTTSAESVTKKLERLLGKEKAALLLEKYDGDAAAALHAIESLLG